MSPRGPADCSRRTDECPHCRRGSAQRFAEEIRASARPLRCRLQPGQPGVRRCLCSPRVVSTRPWTTTARSGLPPGLIENVTDGTNASCRNRPRPAPAGDRRGHRRRGTSQQYPGHLSIERALTSEDIAQIDGGRIEADELLNRRQPHSPESTRSGEDASAALIIYGPGAAFEPVPSYLTPGLSEPSRTTSPR
jgi:hypothetical protein